MPITDPERSFLSSSTATNLKASAMSLRATTPYYSSAHTAARTGTGKAAIATKESAKGLLKSPWIVGALPFINGGLSGMVATAVVQPIDMVKVSHSAVVRYVIRNRESDLVHLEHRCGSN
jgi:hypothetical protein